MKLKTHLVIFFTLICTSTLFPHSVFANPKLKVIRRGEGQLSIAGPWAEGYSIKSTNSTGKYQIERLFFADNPKAAPSIQASWDASRFTDLTLLEQGIALDHFQLVVHGLEIKNFVNGIGSMSFDDFVRTTLNPRVPLGLDFIRYYPYFFHKKTVISASIVTENNTATFGRFGFVLRVPAQNYIACSRTDMHTPTDRDFYGSTPSGRFEINERIREFPLVSLDDLLPRVPVDPKGAPFQMGEAKSKTELAHERLILSLMAIAGEELDADAAEMLSLDHKALSWYNEIAINPVTEAGGPVLIQGIFVRTGESELEKTLAEPPLRALLELSVVYHLPVIHIVDGQYYETDVGL